MSIYLRVIKVPFLIEVMGIILAVVVTMALASTGLVWTVGFGLALPGGAAIAAFFQLIHNCRDHDLKWPQVLLVFSLFYGGHLVAMWILIAASEGAFQAGWWDVTTGMSMIIASWGVVGLIPAGITTAIYWALRNRIPKRQRQAVQTG